MGIMGVEGFLWVWVGVCECGWVFVSVGGCL